MTSLTNYSSKNSNADANTASFVSNIHPANTKQMVYLTHDDLQKRTASLYTLFVSCYIMSLSLFTLIYLIIVMLDRQEYGSQSTACKITFFFDFYCVILMNVGGSIFLFKKYLMFQREKLTDNLTILKDPRQIVTSSSAVFFLFLLLGNICKGSCSQEMFWRVVALFGTELVQMFGMCLANLMYHFKICREFEMSVALDEESGEKGNKKEEQFNGSFALNLSKMSKSNKDKLKYRRRTRTRPTDVSKLEFEATVKDLDSLDIVRKSPELSRMNKSGSSGSPTKRLSAQFRAISVDKSKE